MSVSSQVIISSDGTPIFTDAVGDHEKPAVVFVHGWTLSSTVFDNIFSSANSWGQKFYLVRYDMRGHGRSGKPNTEDGYSSKSYADDFAAVAKTFKLNRPVFVGWSLGAAVVADIAAHLEPSTLSGVVYLGGTPATGDVLQRVSVPRGEILAPLLSDDSTADAARQAIVSWGDFIFGQRQAETASSVVPAIFPTNLGHWELKSLCLGMAIQQAAAYRRFTALRPQDIRPLLTLGAKGLPALIVHGTKDSLIDADKVVEELKPHFRNLEIRLIDEGTHAIHYQNREEVMGYISEFVFKVRDCV